MKAAELIFLTASGHHNNIIGIRSMARGTAAAATLRLLSALSRRVNDGRNTPKTLQNRYFAAGYRALNFAVQPNYVFVFNPQRNVHESSRLFALAASLFLSTRQCRVYFPIRIAKAILCQALRPCWKKVNPAVVNIATYSTRKK